MKKSNFTKETGFLSPSGGAPAVSLQKRYPFEKDNRKYSSVTKLIRVTAYVMRFIAKTRKCSIQNGCLTSEELKGAERMWLHSVQRNSYVDVFQAISSDTRNNLQKQLGLYIDEQGLLRCKGRLDNSDLTEGARRPVLLPNMEHFTHHIIEKRTNKVFIQVCLKL